MSKRLFVGNVNPRVTEEQLRQLFSAAGEVVQVRIPRDRESAQPRGFAFVEFADQEEAEQALALFDDAMLEGRRLRPSIALERQERERSRRRDRPREAVGDLGEEEPEAASTWRGFGDDDYASGRVRGKPRKRGKHGADRKRGHGMRRVID